MEIKVLGIDPALSNFGFAKGTLVLGEALKPIALNITETRLVETKPTKVKSTSKRVDDLDRAKLHADALKELANDVNAIFVEMPVGSQTARAMASYGICIGIFSMLDKPIYIISASDSKIAATNNKNATKAEMIKWAYSHFPNVDWFKGNKDEHVADAIAAIVSGASSNEFKQHMLLSKEIA